jgi:hypothetical protein
MKQVIDIIRNLLDGKWGNNHKEKPLKPSEIGIVYARKDKPVFGIFFSLLKKLRTELGFPVVWLSDRKLRAVDLQGLIKQDAIKIHTIHSAKGLQYKAVIFIWADQLPMNVKDKNKLELESQLAHDQRLFYVGLTRAERYLAVTYTEKSEFTDRLEKASQENEIVAFYCEHCGFHNKAKPKKIPVHTQFITSKCPKCKKPCKIELPIQ